MLPPTRCDLEVPQKGDWREWVPVYGLFQIIRNCNNNNPSVAKCAGQIVYYVSLFYQCTSCLAVAGGAVYLAGSLLDKIV